MRGIGKEGQATDPAPAAGRRLWLLAVLALAVRAAYVFWTRTEPPHMDLGSFLPSSLPLTQPFDTSPREPLFVWWLWLLGKLGAGTTPWIRLATSLWAAPALLLLFRLSDRLLGRGSAWAAVLLYAFLPGQVMSDGVGLRHLIETPCLLLLLSTLYDDPALRRRRNWLAAAGALAALILTRVTYAGSGLLLLCAAGLKARTPRPLLALLPALLLLTGHLRNNYVRHGDAFYSVNLHSYFFSNLEYIGKPGFAATFDDWQKDAYAPRLNFRSWAFGKHTPWEFVRDSAVGMSRGFWDFYEKVYFSLGLPGALRWLLLALYLLGLASALASPELRLIPGWMFLLTLPYAFPGHVFWAGRFFSPFAPLGLLLTVKGGGAAAALAARLKKAERGA
ncbi:MAG: glycosyltransferase family 39 protein [Elusimicrobia bacterium]|nr:glycosyltransferase family 39 protein [Elusimicrobiota bacterium]